MQYPVDTHTHTLASTHAYSTIHDYLAVAKQKGIRLFATTDHGPAMADAPHFWHFVNLRVLPRMVDGVGILRGIEANIKTAKVKSITLAIICRSSILCWQDSMNQYFRLRIRPPIPRR